MCGDLFLQNFVLFLFVSVKASPLFSQADKTRLLRRVEGEYSLSARTPPGVYVYVYACIYTRICILVRRLFVYEGKLEDKKK